LATKVIKKFWKNWKQNQLARNWEDNKSHWLWHVTRMNKRMPKIMLNYRPNGWRWLGRLLKRLLDKAKRIQSRPNLCVDDDDDDNDNLILCKLKQYI
jgi:hypothetical protein